MLDADHTDVTIEVFNGCAGSCTGCLLTAAERKAMVPVTTPGEFSLACDALAAYGGANRRRYRAIIVFGDVPGLPIDLQKRYYAAAAADDLAIGATMTLVDEGRDAHYLAAIDALLNADPNAVFDITVDPVRLFRDPGYGERLRMAIARAPEVHLAALLSEVVLTRMPPAELAQALSDSLLGKTVALGFTPAIERFGAANYGYDIGSAATFARAFYNATQGGREFLAADVGRFRASGGYGAFMKQTFHVGAGLDVFPTAYTVFGDVVLDRRNRHEPLGSLKTDDLSAILDGRIARRLAAKAAAGIHSGDFGCGGCPHLESCVFNGIGAVRNLYGEFEFRAGACYGPASLEPQTLPPHRVSSFNPVEVFRLMVERGMGSGPGHPTGALGAT